MIVHVEWWHKFLEFMKIDTLTWGPATASLAAQIVEDTIINDDRRGKHEDVFIAADYEKAVAPRSPWVYDWWAGDDYRKI